MQEILSKNNSRRFLLDQLNESFQASRHRNDTVHEDADGMISTINREKWSNCRQLQECLCLLLLLGMVCETEVVEWCIHYKKKLLNARSYSFLVMTIDSSNWMANICFFNVSYHLRLNALRYVLHTKTNSVIWHRDLQNPFFPFLDKHIIWFYSMLVKLLTQQLYLISSFMLWMRQRHSLLLEVSRK